MRIVIAEKPSVAKAIRAVLRRNGVRAMVVGLRGHVLDADLPDGFEWNRVDPIQIFDVRDFREVVRDEEVYQRLRELFTREPVEELIIATDNDSEGELIGYEVLRIYERLGKSGAKFSRMRFNSLKEEELWEAWNNRESDLNWRWVERAVFRRNFDLITGAAFTRILTISARRHGLKGVISWGSCQTPTLNYLVRREEEIISFKPKKYWTITAVLRNGRGERFKAASRRFYDRSKAQSIYESVKDEKGATVLAYKEKERILKRPQPLRTDDMLRELNRITGLSAARILSVAESLYSNGYISYPRTETNIWPRRFDHRIPTDASIRSGLIKPSEISGVPKPMQGRLSDGAHPPIYPVKPYNRDGSINWRVWEYIARRYLANAYYPDALLLKQTATIEVGGLKLRSRGSKLSSEGFYKIFHYFKPKEEALPRLSLGEDLEVVEVKLVEGETRPPPRFSEAMLLKLMERDGIGTDATRAEYPRILLKRGYAVRDRRVLKPTQLGLSLIRHLRKVDESLTSPETRRRVEEYMRKISVGVKRYRESLEESLRIYLRLYEKLRERAEEIGEELAAPWRNARIRNR